MSDCECKFVPPVEAHSFTGLATTQIICDVNSHADIKHWLVVRNRRGYTLEISVSAEIAEPRLVKFTDCPDFALPDKGSVNDHSWYGEVTLEANDDYTFGVFLSSDAQNGKKQQQTINIYVASRVPFASVDQRYSNHIIVTALEP
jgi:hypothetical protein